MINDNWCVSGIVFVCVNYNIIKLYNIQGDAFKWVH